MGVISGFGFGSALTLSNYINMLIVVKKQNVKQKKVILNNP